MSRTGNQTADRATAGRRFPCIRACGMPDGMVGVLISAQGPEYVMTEEDADALYTALARTHLNKETPND